ncbi:MAG: prolyl oligopeptidase family serine peptidase [Candidatus Latescibacteria bacterium]|nr:prolyl oligopeptidase family serine peptidase [Candidatus Latescibacterota bacterium]
MNSTEHYPTPAQVDAWLEGIWRDSNGMECKAELLENRGWTGSYGIRHMRDSRYVRFTPSSSTPFYGYWQPAPSQPAPLLVHTPGYGAEISAHPDLVMSGFNVLHINPLGYLTPEGEDASKRRGDTWPVGEDTLLSGGAHGYRDWFSQCVLAINWAWSQDSVLGDRVSFFGTSQGGGASILLGSLFKDRGVRCVAADVPWMVDFLAQNERGSIPKIRDIIESMEDPINGWHALGLIDSMSHARRLRLPVMLTAGSEDETCPPYTIESLFEALPNTKLYCKLEGQGHAYTQEFIALATSWFRLYA